MAKQITAYLVAIVAFLTISGFLAAGYKGLYTEEEAHVHIVAEEMARGTIISQHQNDKISQEKARANDRADRLDSEIRQLDKEFRFGNLNEVEKQYNRDTRRDLESRKACIQNGRC